MDDFRSIAQKLLNDVTDSLGRTDPRSFLKFVQALSKRRTILVAGEGRSAAAGRAFAHALADLGRDVHVLGESTTPGIKLGDMLIVLTENGSSPLMAQRVTTARGLAASVTVITAEGHSKLLRDADPGIVLPPPARTPFTTESAPGARSLVFCEALMLYLDAAVQALAQGLSRRDFRNPGASLD